MVMLYPKIGIFMSPKKEKPTPDGEVAPSKPSAPQKAENPEVARPQIGELIQSAETFEQLLAAFNDSEGIPQKVDGEDSFYGEDRVRFAINDLLGFLDIVATSSDYLLNTPAKTLGKDHVKFNSIPEEEGLREKMMELYDKHREELLKSKRESPNEEVAPEAPKVEKMFVEPVVSDEQLDEFTTSYLDTVVTYRVALEDAYERLKALEEQKGLGSLFKKHILRKTPELSEDEQEHLRELRNATEIEWKRIHDSLKQIVLVDKGGTTEEFSHVLVSLGENISTLTAKEEKEEVIIPKALMSRYESIVFTKLHPDPTASPEEMQRHQEYLRRKEEEKEVEAAVGKFVPTKTEEGEPAKMEEGISPEKSITALKVLQQMRGENSETMKRAKEVVEKTAKNAYSAVMAGGEWYKKLPKGQKIALTCALASIGLIGAATSAPLLFGSALVGKTVQRTFIASGTAAGINALLTAKAERERSEGKAESWVSKRKELLAISGGLAAFVLPRIFSAEARHIISEMHITDPIKNWFSGFSSAPVAAETIPAATEIHATPIDIPAAPTFENLEVTTQETVAESIPAKPDAPSMRKAIFIDDKLGRKGNSIWGALKHNGVSEKAIANYEKSHPGEIERRARNGDIVTFTYDKDSNVLRDVKFEGALKKVARGAKQIAESTVTTDRGISEYDTTGQTAPETNLSAKGHGATSGGVHQQEIKAQKLADAEAKKQGIIEKKSRLKVRGILSSESAKNPIEGPLPTNKEIVAGDETLALYKDDATPDVPGIPQFIPFNVTEIENTNPSIAIEMKGYFDTAEAKSWSKLAVSDALKILNADNNAQLTKILGKRGFSLPDAISGQHLLMTISNESGIKPNKGEKVMEYIERAVQKLPKVAQK